MKPSKPFSAVRRAIFVATASAKCQSSVGATYSDAAPDGAWKNYLPTILQRCRTYGAAKNPFWILPPLAEQQRIASRGEELMRQCDAPEAQLRQTRALKQGLMQELLTGRIRLM